MITEIIEIIIIIILIIINGILTMAELAIISSRKYKLLKYEQEGHKSARTAINLLEDSTNFLSTFQIGITASNIILGVVGGATLAGPLSAYLGPYIPYSYTISYIIIVLITTYFTLIVGEIAPKQIAINKPERIAIKVASSMETLSRISAPIVKLLSDSTNLLLRILGEKSNEKHEITEEEVNLLIEEGIEEGNIEEEEKAIIQRVFRLDAQKVDMIMTPRNEIVWLDLEDSDKENKAKIIESKRSIFPVASGELDDFIGVVQAKDLLGSLFNGRKLDLKKELKNPLVVPDNLLSMELLTKFKQNQHYVHMALVVDEFGTVLGLITLNDLLEGIVGDIPGIDEMDDPKAIELKDHSWLMDGRITIDRFKEIFNITDQELPNEEEDNFSTIAGFILGYLEKIPTDGETFTWDKFCFEILRMDGNQIDKILINIVEPKEKEDTEENDKEDNDEE